jgi:ribose 5-phosphate isomerase B
MKVVIAADHAGFEYKKLLAFALGLEGFELIDLGADSLNEEDDYPDYASAVALALLNGEAERGILICGSAVGVSIAANKFRGVRAGVCNDAYTAHQCVEHDDVNILCLGQRVTGVEVALEIASIFLKAEFSHALRHQRRLDKIAAIESKNMHDGYFE